LSAARSTIGSVYLAWKAREYGRYARFIKLAGEINTWMVTWFGVWRSELRFPTP